MTSRSRNTAATSPLVAYLGWHGNRNIGDDAIYDVVAAELRGAAFMDLPQFPHQVAGEFLSGRAKDLRRARIVVGGGTLAGRLRWRLVIKQGMALTRNNGTYAIGVGVEDPVFVGRRSGSGRGELGRWAPLLSKFRKVSVRGPRSAELLADIGVNVQVSGDPALLLPRPDVSPEEGLIGVNLGFGDDLWGHDAPNVAEQLSVGVKELANRGYRFVGILLSPSDRKLTETALRHVDADIVAPATAEDTIRELASCSVNVVTRLHAAILASVSYTPVVSLEYQPKCRDFALSIDDEGSLIRTDRITGSAVVDGVLDRLANAAEIRDKKRILVGELKQRLAADYDVVRKDLGLSTHDLPTAKG